MPAASAGPPQLAGGKWAGAEVEGVAYWFQRAMPGDFALGRRERYRLYLERLTYAFRQDTEGYYGPGI